MSVKPTNTVEFGGGPTTENVGELVGGGVIIVILVGELVGGSEGEAIGSLVGSNVGVTLGLLLGWIVGAALGESDGVRLGDSVGDTVGATKITFVSAAVGVVSLSLFNSRVVNNMASAPPAASATNKMRSREPHPLAAETFLCIEQGDEVS